MGMNPRLLRPLSTIPTFIEKGYTRLWGLSAKSTATISGSAATDTGFYAVQWQGKPAEVYQSGQTFLETPIVGSSANALTVTSNGAVISAAQSKFGGASALFSGAGGLSVDGAALPELGVDGSFTLEMWVYPLASSVQGLVSRHGGNTSDWESSDSMTIQCYLNGDYFTFAWRNPGGGLTILGATEPSPVLQWHHVAATYDGTTTRVFVNGQLAGSSTDAYGGITAGVPVYEIGEENGSLLLNAHIDDFRIVQGTALYTSSFSVPASSLTAVTGTSLLLNFDAPTKGKRAFEVYPVNKEGTALLLNFDGNFNDAAGNFTFTQYGSPTFSSSPAKTGFGQSANLIAGALKSNEPISIPEGSDFTIELWHYNNTGRTPYGAGQQPVLFGIVNSWETVAGGELWVNVNDDSRNMFVVDGVIVLTQGYSSPSPAFQQWEHVAIVRSGGMLSVYQNGHRYEPMAAWNNAIYGYIHVAPKGEYGGIANLWTWEEIDTADYQGYIDNLRITLGVAKWTEDFSDELPSSPVGVEPLVYQNAGQFNAFDLSGNSIKALRAEGVSLDAATAGYTAPYYPYAYIPASPAGSGSIADNSLSSQALDQFYTDLLAGGGDLFVQGNPGIDADDPTIATAKGYTVFGSVPPSTSLLLNFNGTNGSSVFTDSSPNQLSVTAYIATISTAQSKFGGSSAYFDGTGYLEIAPGEWCDFAGRDFTIEFWYRSVPGQGDGGGTSGTGILSFGWDSVSTTAPVMLYRDGSDIWLYSDLYGWGSPQIAAPSIDDGQWHHIAICGTPSVVQAYLDGTQTISTSASAAWQNPTNNVTVGASADGLATAVAYIDDLRIIKGAALYTGPFAVPASQLGVYP